MLKVQDKPFTNIEDITKINMVTQNVVVCTSLPAGINLCGHSADCNAIATVFPKIVFSCCYMYLWSGWFSLF